MSNDLNYFRRRAAEEAAIARDAAEPRAASIHRALSTAYLRRASELVDVERSLSAGSWPVNAAVTRGEIGAAGQLL